MSRKRLLLVLLALLALLLLLLAPQAGRAEPASPCAGDSTAPCCALLPLVPLGVSGDFSAGCTPYVLDPGRPDGGRAGRDVLELPACDTDPCVGNGAEAIRCRAANGYPCCLDTAYRLSVAPGNKSGALRQGLRERWAKDTDRRSGICATSYTGNGWRYVNVLVVEPAGGPGTSVSLLRAARFFLVNSPEKPGDDLLGNFLGYVSRP